MPQLNIRSGWQSSPPTLDNVGLTSGTTLPYPRYIHLIPCPATAYSCRELLLAQRCNGQIS